MGALEELADFDDKVEKGDISKDTILVKTIERSLAGLEVWSYPKDEAIALGQTQTRQYAKRQMTWFRNRSKGQQHQRHSNYFIKACRSFVLRVAFNP